MQHRQGPKHDFHPFQLTASISVRSLCGSACVRLPRPATYILWLIACREQQRRRLRQVPRITKKQKKTQRGHLSAIKATCSSVWFLQIQFCTSLDCALFWLVIYLCVFCGVLPTIQMADWMVSKRCRVFILLYCLSDCEAVMTMYSCHKSNWTCICKCNALDI